MLKQKHTVEVEGMPLSFSTGTLAQRANGSVMVQSGDTVVFVSATMAKEVAPDQDFFPLTVDYREKFSAAGRFPGGYIKREGKPTEKEILTSRLCDRPLRPLFPSDFLNEVQIIGLLLSTDLKHESDILMVNGASAALMCSDIPWGGPIGCVRIAQVNGEFVINPTNNQQFDSDLDLIYVGTRDRALMIEGCADQLPEARFIEALHKAQQAIQPILDAHCVRCHAGGTLKDGRPAPFSLLGDEDHSVQGRAINARSGRRFSESYLRLTQYGNNKGAWCRWIGIQEGPEMLPPYFSGAAKSPLIAMFRARPEDRAEFHKDVAISEKEIKTLALWIDLLAPYCGDYVEDANWTPEERAEYEYAMAKRRLEDGFNAFNTSLKARADATGNASLGDESLNISFGGPEDKRAFKRGFLSRRLPSAARRDGALNVYRNVALNPRDVQGDEYEARIYPHASSNSEYGWLDEFAAKNAIDGKKENQGHGPEFPSWGPNLRCDLWLKIDFGCEVEIDKAVIYARADFPHDSWWRYGTLEFSDGSTEKIELVRTAEPQTFTFSPRRATWVKLTNLYPAETPLKWCGVTEIEFWGVTANSKE